ncbi:hypothetical protein GCM10010406_12840 [Streptomyces thermolineatus]|uniref:Uncharacterized protein n=1 Tax=Streptomyces thermolineatus TaxID=44033 RepID=A0ABN3L5E7_9ACTN
MGGHEQRPDSAGEPRDLHGELRPGAEDHRPGGERTPARAEEEAAAAGPSSRPRRTRRTRRFRGPLLPAGVVLPPWMRTAGAASGIVGVLGVGGLTVALTDNAAGPPQTVAGTTGPTAPAALPPAPSSSAPRPSPSSSGPGRTDGGGSNNSSGKDAGDAAGRPARERTTTPPASSSPAPKTSIAGTSPRAASGNRAEDGYLWSDGAVDPQSNDYWAQSDVTLRTRKPMDELTVTVRIALTEGVGRPGSWTSLPGGDFRTSVLEEGGELIFRFVLAEGARVPEGEHVFAVQYEHAAGGRDAGGDSYSAEGGGPAGDVSVRGDFH